MLCNSQGSLTSRLVELYTMSLFVLWATVKPAQVSPLKAVDYAILLFKKLPKVVIKKH